MESTVEVKDNAGNTYSVSKDIAPVVKHMELGSGTVPLFPTKNGFEYYVFKMPNVVR